MIIIQFDKAYKKWGELFLRSLAKHDPKRKVLMSTVGLNGEDINEFRGYYPNLIIENEDISENKYRLPLRKDNLSLIMPCRKAYVLKDAMERYDEDLYILMDADLLIRKPLDKLYKMMLGNDVGIIFRENDASHKKLASGILAVRGSAKGLIDLWIKEMEGKHSYEKIKPWAWFWDQITLWRAYSKNKELSYVNIPKKDYIDMELREQAVIWSAHIDKTKEVKDEVYGIFNDELEGISPEFTFPKAAEYCEKGYYGLSYVFVRRLLENEPDNLEVWFFYGNLLILAKDPKGAIDAYKNLVKSNYKNKDIRNNLGLCYILLKEYDKAEEQFKLGLEEYPDYEKLKSNLEYVRFLRGEGGSSKRSF